MKIPLLSEIVEFAKNNHQKVLLSNTRASLIATEKNQYAQGYYL